VKNAPSLMYQYLQSFFFNTLQVNTSYAFLPLSLSIPYISPPNILWAQKRPQKSPKKGKNMTTEKQIKANQANSKKSTGATSDAYVA